MFSLYSHFLHFGVIFYYLAVILFLSHFRLMSSQLIKAAWDFCPEVDLAHCMFELNFNFRVLQHDVFSWQLAIPLTCLSANSVRTFLLSFFRTKNENLVLKIRYLRSSVAARHSPFSSTHSISLCLFLVLFLIHIMSNLVWHCKIAIWTTIVSLVRPQQNARI